MSSNSRLDNANLYEDWDNEGGKEWELPGEFLAGKRRFERNGDQSYFFSEQEISAVMNHVRGGQLQTLEGAGEEE